MSASLPSSVFAEFVGTFVLVFTVGANVLGKTSADWAVTSIASSLMAMIYATASISGGHLNPSVTLASLFLKKTSLGRAVAYVAAQIGAGIAASLCFTSIFQDTTSIGPADGFSWWQACGVETIYTAMLALVVLCVTSRQNNPEDQPNQFYGLAIGFVVIAGGYGGGKISGGAFNPAVAIGLGIFGHVIDSLWYVVFQVLGSLVAVLFFRALRPEDSSGIDLAEYEPRLVTRMLSEFTGTFLLVLTVGLNVLGSSTASAWSAAAALLSMVYALGDVSGGHFNPAVSLAVAISGKGLTLRDLIVYWIAQAAAGVMAGLIYTAFYSGTTFSLGPKASYTDSAAYLLEFMFTLILCHTVLSVACVKGITSPVSRNNYFGLAIAGAVVGGGFAAGNVSGGCLNPAVSLGIGISNMTIDGAAKSIYILGYCMAELCGGLGAALLFFSSHVREYTPKMADRRLFHQPELGLANAY